MSTSAHRSAKSMSAPRDGGAPGHPGRQCNARQAWGGQGRPLRVTPRRPSGCPAGSGTPAGRPPGTVWGVKLGVPAVAPARRADIDFADRCAEVDILVKGVGPVRHVAQIVAPRYVARVFNLEPALAAVTGALDLLSRRLGGHAGLRAGPGEGGRGETGKCVGEVLRAPLDLESLTRERVVEGNQHPRTIRIDERRTYNCGRVT